MDKILDSNYMMSETILNINLLQKEKNILNLVKKKTKRKLL